jgi:hypothetical protein
MNINDLLKFLLISINLMYYSYAHSASSSSALATSSFKFKSPKLDKEKNLIGRKNKIGIDGDLDDDDSKSFQTKKINSSYKIFF